MFSKNSIQAIYLQSIYNIPRSEVFQSKCISSKKQKCLYVSALLLYMVSKEYSTVPLENIPKPTMLGVHSQTCKSNKKSLRPLIFHWASKCSRSAKCIQFHLARAHSSHNTHKNSSVFGAAVSKRSMALTCTIALELLSKLKICIRETKPKEAKGTNHPQMHSNNHSNFLWNAKESFGYWNRCISKRKTHILIHIVTTP